MKLSDAIDEGLKLGRPEMAGNYFGYLYDGQLGSCALGSAYEAEVRSQGRTLTDEELVKVGLSDVRAAFPEVPEDIFGECAALNDHVGLPNAKIAA